MRGLAALWVSAAIASCIVTASPAYAFDLLSPPNRSEINSVAVFDWEPAAGASSYTLVFFEDDVEFARIAGIRESRYGVDASLGLSAGLRNNEDKRRFTWRVEASARGAVLRSRQTFRVDVTDSSLEQDTGSTVEPFPVPGLLRGFVRGEEDRSRLLGANVTAGPSGRDVTDFRGEYLIVLAPGRYRVRVKASGFADARTRTVRVRTGRTVRAPDVVLSPRPGKPPTPAERRRALEIVRELIGAER